MEDLKEALGTSADATVFRKLAGAGLPHQLPPPGPLLHPGRGRPLRRVRVCGRSARCGSPVSARWCRPSRRWSTASEAGYDAAELEAVLHVEAKAALLGLVRAGRLAREQVAGRYVYFSAAGRRPGGPSWRPGRSMTPRPAGFPRARACGCCPDELKAAIVLFYSLLDERQRRLYAGLEALKVGHGGDAQVAELLGDRPGHRGPGPPRAAGRRGRAGPGAPPGAGREATPKKHPRGDRRASPS